MSSIIIPTLKYAHAGEAIDWLCEAFGFTRHLVVPGEDGVIEHAQLTLDSIRPPQGNGMIMLGSVRESSFDRLQKTPMALGGVSQSPYIVVEDVDAHYERALAAGAEIVMEPQDQSYGGRLYSCYDLEKHLWNFGSYDPWKAEQ